jgi:hypothetical protein
MCNLSLVFVFTALFGVAFPIYILGSEIEKRILPESITFYLKQRYLSLGSFDAFDNKAFIKLSIGLGAYNLICIVF